MRLVDPLIAELEQESHATRRVLERVPDVHLAWRPHPKSFSLGQLALHVATIPGTVAQLFSVVPVPEPPPFESANPPPFPPEPPPFRPGPPPPANDEAPGRPWHQVEDARLVAMQMAIAGSSRGEVGDHLATVLGIADSNGMLDQIFGAGSGPEQRLPGTG